MSQVKIVNNIGRTSKLVITKIVTSSEAYDIPIINMECLLIQQMTRLAGGD